MNLPKLAIERPVFMSCLVIMIMVLGIMGYLSLGVDMFPDVSFPFVFVTTPYSGASPEEIETQISKPLEDELSTLPGVKEVNSTNQEGYSSVWIQFTLETDAKDAEQQVRDHVAFVRPNLPKGVDEPIIRRFDPMDQAVVILSLESQLSAADAYDLADQIVKPRLAEVPGVGVVNITGGQKREIQVQLDRNQLNRYRISAGQVADRIGLNGMNVPVGKVELGSNELMYRSVGEYNDLERIRKTPINFFGSDVSVTVDKLGLVLDTIKDADSYCFKNDQQALILGVFKQSKANSVAVVEQCMKRMKEINELLKTRPGSPHLELVQDAARPIRLNLMDVQITIFEGICLTILVVLLFLGSFRSTLITITALPVSLLGAFFLMNSQGYTLNVMTLLALSLAVGLLIDDAIVVRENIWRHIEEGVDPKKAAVEGALQVALAVVATSSVVIAVFLPIAFLHGIVGQFFRQFGLTVCFAMGISLFESMVMGPLLSAYWGKKGTQQSKEIPVVGWVLRKFGEFQDALEAGYEVLIGWCLRFPVEKILSDTKESFSFAPLLSFFLQLAMFVIAVSNKFMPMHVIFLSVQPTLLAILSGLFLLLWLWSLVKNFSTGGLFHNLKFWNFIIGGTLFWFSLASSTMLFLIPVFFFILSWIILFSWFKGINKFLFVIRSKKLVETVQKEVKEGYSFAPLLSIVLQLAMFAIAASNLFWPLHPLFIPVQPVLLVVISLVFLIFWVLGFMKKPSLGGVFHDLKFWNFLIGGILFGVSLGSSLKFFLIPALFFALGWVLLLIHYRYFLFAHFFYDHRWWVITTAVFLFLGAMLGLGPKIKFTFLPTSDVGEFVVLLKSAPGTSLEAMKKMTAEVEQLIRKHPEVMLVEGSIGGEDAFGIVQGANRARLYVRLTPYQGILSRFWDFMTGFFHRQAPSIPGRRITTSEIQALVRGELVPFKDTLQPQVAEASSFGDQAPFTLRLTGDDYSALVPFALKVADKVSMVKDLADVQSTYEGGKPEFQAVLDPDRMKGLGVSGVDAGMELRTQVEGIVPAKLREPKSGLEYDIRVRMKEDQRDLQKEYAQILVPNQNHNMVRLSEIAKPVTTLGPATINRQNRVRNIMITGQLSPGGALGGAINDATQIMKEIQIPPGVTYQFVGQAQDLGDLMWAMLEAVGLAVLFTYMILASLYESPIIPFTIMLAIPLAIVGAFLALFIGQQIVPTLSLNIFSMVALIMLLGLVTKNSILLVDYTLQMMRKGMPRNEALKAAGKVRLRPILMTTFALIAGMLPVALALTEVGKFRQSMGVAIEGGLLSSLILTLVIVPSVFGYVDDFRLWLRKVFHDQEKDPLQKQEIQGKLRARHRST